MGLTWEPRSWPDGLRPTKRLWRRENFPGPPGPIGRRGWTPQRRVSARSSGRRPHPRPSFCAKWPRGSGGRFFPVRDGAAPTAARGCFCSVRTWATAFAIRTARRPARVRWKFGLCSAPGTPEGRRRFNETRLSTAASLPPAYGCRMAPGAGVPDQVSCPVRVSRDRVRISHTGPEDEAGTDLLGGGADGRGPLKWGKGDFFDFEIEQMNAKGGET